jgi:glycine/D-amino acid oxidase-like deaminating enzyme
MTSREWQNTQYIQARKLKRYSTAKETLQWDIRSFTGSLNAYKFVIGMLKLCLNEGINLQTSTRVMKLERNEDGPWRVNSDRGAIRAKQVILATNGYTANLLKDFQGVIVPQRGQLTSHRPGSQHAQAWISHYVLVSLLQRI